MELDLTDYFIPNSPSYNYRGQLSTLALVNNTWIKINESDLKNFQDYFTISIFHTGFVLYRFPTKQTQRLIYYEYQLPILIIDVESNSIYFKNGI